MIRWACRAIVVVIQRQRNRGKPRLSAPSGDPGERQAFFARDEESTQQREAQRRFPGSSGRRLSGCQETSGQAAAGAARRRWRAGAPPRNRAAMTGCRPDDGKPGKTYNAMLSLFITRYRVTRDTPS